MSRNCKVLSRSRSYDVLSRLGLEAMMSRLGLGRFGPRSSSAVNVCSKSDFYGRYRKCHLPKQTEFS